MRDLTLLKAFRNVAARKQVPTNGRVVAHCAFGIAVDCEEDWIARYDGDCVCRPCNNKIHKMARTQSAKNRAQGKCEVCNRIAQESSTGKLYVHHSWPVSAGPIVNGMWINSPNNLFVLCNECHRWAHGYRNNPLTPLESVERTNITINVTININIGVR